MALFVLKMNNDIREIMGNDMIDFEELKLKLKEKK